MSKGGVLSGQQLKTHIKVYAGFPKDNTTSSSDREPAPPRAQGSPRRSSKHSKEVKSDNAKESSSHSKSTKESSSHKSHKKSKDRDDAQEKDKRGKDQPKSEKSRKK